jgi:hypothetical protein
MASVDTRNQAGAETSGSNSADTIRTWLADHWPKAALALGLGITIAWMGLLIWLLNQALGVF